MEEILKPKSRLAWKQIDYIETNQDIPDTLLFDNLHTEGELMSREEIDLWLSDTNATFCLIRESNEKKFEELFADFEADLQYLVSLRKITDEEKAALLNKKFYKF